MLNTYIGVCALDMVNVETSSDKAVVVVVEVVVVMVVVLVLVILVHKDFVRVYDQCGGGCCILYFI